MLSKILHIGKMIIYYQAIVVVLRLQRTYYRAVMTLI